MKREEVVLVKMNRVERDEVERLAFLRGVKMSRAVRDAVRAELKREDAAASARRSVEAMG